MKMKAPLVPATVLIVENVKTAMRNALYVLTNMKNAPRLAKYSAQIVVIKINWNVFVTNGADIANRLTEGVEQSANIREISTLETSIHSNSLLLSQTDFITFVSSQ